MTIAAVVKKPNLIIANTVGLTTTQSNPNISLKNNLPGLGQSFVYMHTISDVTEIDPQNGDTLQYDSTTHKYVVGQIKIPNTPLDGGSF